MTSCQDKEIEACGVTGRTTVHVQYIHVCAHDYLYACVCVCPHAEGNLGCGLLNMQMRAYLPPAPHSGVNR